MSASIELSGEFCSNKEREDAIKAFAILFNCECSDIERLLNNAPIIIKSDLENSKAEKLKALIDATGLKCRLVLGEQPKHLDPLQNHEVDDYYDESDDLAVAVDLSFSTRFKSWFGR